MINLNLLPPKEKEEVKFETSRQYLLFFGRSFIFILIILIVLLFSVYLYLSITLEAQKDLVKITREAPESQALEKIKKEIEETNNKITKIYKTQSDFVLWSKIIEDLISSVRPEQKIYLKIFSGKKQDSQITISGFAQTREDLIDFERSLGKSDKFLDINSPISNFLKKTEINFNLTFKFKK